MIQFQYHHLPLIPLHSLHLCPRFVSQHQCSTFWISFDRLCCVFVFFFGVIVSHSESSSSTLDLRLFPFGVRLGCMASSRVALLCSQSAHVPFQYCIITYPSPIGFYHIPWNDFFT